MSSQITPATQKPQFSLDELEYLFWIEDKFTNKYAFWLRQKATIKQRAEFEYFLWPLVKKHYLEGDRKVMQNHQFQAIIKELRTKIYSQIKKQKL